MKEKQRTRGAVIVTRVSSGVQVKGTSLEDQLDVCRLKASLLEVPIVAEYEDAGVSGAYLLLRTGMQQAIADIREGRADTLICATFDRYSRDEEHQHRIRREVTQVGGRIVFCDVDFDDTPEGDLNFTIQGGFKAYERKVIRKRLLGGKQRRAREGQQPARSRPPYGYLIVTHAHVIRGEFPPDQLGRYHHTEKADLGRWMFEGYADGTLSLPKICRELNLKGEATPGQGIAWHEATVRVILTNPVYKGEPVSGRIKHYVDETLLAKPHPLTGVPRKTAEVRYLAPEESWIPLTSPPVVSRDLWDKVQTRMTAMNGMGGGSPRKLRIISGLVYCPDCGARAVVKHQIANKVTYRYYLCGAQRKARLRTTAKPCTGSLYPIDIVEEAVILALREAFKRPEAIAAALRVYRDGQATPAKPRTGCGEIRSVEAALKALKAEEAAAIQAQIAGIRAGASAEAYADVFADIAIRRKEMEDRRGALAKMLGTHNDGDDMIRCADDDLIRQALHDANKALQDPEVSPLDKRNLVGILIQKVIPAKEGAEIHFVPGAFIESGDKTGGRQTFHTTCIGISTQR